MPSASMYASPYTHKDPPPRIIYPGMFSGCNRITFRYVLDSKLLALCTLLLGLSLVIMICMVITPFWFELKLSDKDGTFGSRPVKKGLTVNSGLFFMDEGHFTNLVFLSKYTNQDVVPKLMAFAQTCSIFGVCLLVGCFAGTFMLMLRRFASATGCVFLAGATTFSAALQLLCILLCGIMVSQSSCEPGDSGCVYEENLVWRMLPLHTQMYRVEPHLTPYLTANWAFYIAAIGSLLVLVSAILLWIEALITLKNLSGIRYQQLRETRDPYAHDINPAEGKKYVYAPPQGYGPASFGMQPVVYATNPYNQPPSVSAYPSGDIGLSRPPPYRPSSESGSSAVGTREIDL